MVYRKDARVNLRPWPDQIPFIKTPPGIRDLKSLMAFDKRTSAIHEQFRRAVHPIEIPRAADQPRTVVVRRLAPGVRVRLFEGTSR